MYDIKKLKIKKRKKLKPGKLDFIFPCMRRGPCEDSTINKQKKKDMCQLKKKEKKLNLFVLLSVTLLFTYTVSILSIVGIRQGWPTNIDF